jgi:hypothetical protein
MDRRIQMLFHGDLRKQLEQLPVMFIVQLWEHRGLNAVL